MSVLPPEADIFIVGINVCYVPQADIKAHADGFRMSTTTSQAIAA
jgi:hypothetical protein